MSIKTVRLAELLAAAGPALHDAGIRDHSVLASAGSYTRRAPLHLDMERATQVTRDAFAGYARVLRQDYGPIHLVALNHALLIGQGTVVTRNGKLLRESAAELLAYGLVPQGLLRVSDDTWHLQQPPRTQIGGPTLLVERPWYRNYGHCIVEFGTILAAMAGQLSGSDWKIAIGANDSPWMRRIVFELIACLCPATPILEHRDDETWLFDDLRYPTPLHIPPLFKWPPGLEAVRRMVLGQASPVREGQPRRLFLPRRDAAERRLTNEAEVQACLAEHGFAPIRLDGPSVSSQAALFSEAEAVIGVKGAALTNIVFCQPTCPVMVLSPGDFPDPFFWDIAGQRGMPYGELFGAAETGRPTGRNDFTIDVEALRRMLAVMLPGARG